MAGWHHQLNGHRFQQTLGDSEGQGSLAFCSPLGCRVRHDWVTEQQYTNLHRKISLYMLYISFLRCFRPLITPWKRGQNSKLLCWMVTTRDKQSFIYLFIFHLFVLEANYFTILQWFLSYIDMNQPWIYMYSPSQSPLPPLSTRSLTYI